MGSELNQGKGFVHLVELALTLVDQDFSLFQTHSLHFSFRERVVHKDDMARKRIVKEKSDGPREMPQWRPLGHIGKSAVPSGFPLG